MSFRNILDPMSAIRSSDENFSARCGSNENFLAARCRHIMLFGILANWGNTQNPWKYGISWKTTKTMKIQDFSIFPTFPTFVRVPKNTMCGHLAAKKFSFDPHRAEKFSSELRIALIRSKMFRILIKSVFHTRKSWEIHENP